MNLCRNPVRLRRYLLLLVAPLTVLSPSAQSQDAPLITTQPHSRILPQGSNVAFSLTANGTEPLAYQWYWSGTALLDSMRIQGCRAASLSLSNVLAEDAGDYFAVVTNSQGSVTSELATLTVLLPPTISDIPDQRTFGNTVTRPIPFTVGDQETPASNLTLAASSSDPMVVSTNGIAFGGSGSNRTVTVTPAGNSPGTATLIITVTDEHGQIASDSFALTVGDFSEAAAGLPQLYRGGVRWVDFDNDGDLDAFISGFDTNYTARTWLCRNDGGAFTNIPTTLPGLGRAQVDWADFDNDGDADLVISGETSYFPGYPGGAIYRNDGDGQFVWMVGIPGGANVNWTDFNHDGRPDLLASVGNSSSIYWNTGDGAFSNTVLNGVSGAMAGGMAVADYDGDGEPDLLLAGGYVVSGAHLYRNLGHHSFSDSGLPLLLFYDMAAAWPDFDIDGKPDLFLAGYTDRSPSRVALLYHNEGSAVAPPGLTNLNVALPGVRYPVAAWGDCDSDGRPDLCLGGFDGSAYIGKIFRNVSASSPPGATNLFAELGSAIPGQYGSSADWGDYDNDGGLDLLYSSAPAPDALGAVRLFHNDGAMPDSPPSAPSGLVVELIPNAALLSWTVATDPEQSNGLSYNVRIGTVSKGIDVVSPLADVSTGFRRVPRMGNAGYRTSLLITNLPAGTYFWSVQAIDNGFKGSPFAVEQRFELPAPVITNQPQSLTVLAGSPVEFVVAATGANPLVYQWQFNGANLAGGTNATLVLPNVQGQDTGTYTVIVFNLFGSVTSSNATLVVNTPPIILTQPQSVTAIEGTNVSFSVAATGDAPLTYQWLQEGVPIDGGTNPVLNLGAILPSQAGHYSVVITNRSGTTNSVTAMLDIPASVPFIVRQPDGQFVPPGLGVTAHFSVACLGTTPFSYQWLFGGSEIPGATNSSLSITNVQTSDAGTYAVRVTNLVGPTLSAEAELRSMPAANSTLHSLAQTNVADFIYDETRDTLYIVTGGNNLLRFHLGSNAFLSPLPIAGTLTSLDLSPDASLLAVGDRNYSSTDCWMWLVDLRSNTVRQVRFERPSAEGGIFSVAFGNDGAVMSTAQFTSSASGAVALRRYDPATDTTTVPRGVGRDSPLTVSADGSMMAIPEPQDSGGIILTYNVAARFVDGFVFADDYLSAVAGVSRDGTQFAEPAWGGTKVFTNRHTSDWSRHSYLTTISNGSAVVYHPSRDLMFLGWGATRELRSYETTTLTEVAAFDFGAALNNSRLRFSRDGRLLFGSVPGAINWIEWTNIAPTFAVQPASQFVLTGTHGVLSARVFGTPPIRFQWRRDGVSLPGETNSTLVTGPLTWPAPITGYQVIAYNPFGVCTSTSATLTVVSPPFITHQPEDQIALAGRTVTIPAVADGSAPLGYRWRFAGTNIPWAGTAVLTLTNVQATSAGLYSVIVTNFVGSVTSSAASLEVIPAPPAFILDPQSRSTFVGTNLTIAAQAMGTEPIAYQWLKDGIRLAGKTSTPLLLSNVQTKDSGIYSLEASNVLDVVTSAPASIVVTAIPPAFVVQPVSHQTVPGFPTTFSPQVTGTVPMSFQWQLNGTNIPGATQAGYTIASVGPNDLGVYHLVASNEAAVVVSADAALAFGPIAVWGQSNAGQLNVPLSASNVVMLSAGSLVNGSATHSLALRADGTIVAWGNNLNGQCDVPAGATNIVAVAAGGSHSLALRADGTVLSWGDDSYGQASPPPDLDNVVSIAASAWHSLAVRADGSVVAWGLGDSGQNAVPPELNGVVMVADGPYASAALREDGTVAAWGTDTVARGQQPTTVLPPNLKEVTGVSLGNNLGLFLRSNGTIMASGANTYGKTAVPATLTNAAAVAAGDFYVLALRSNGLIEIWGRQDWGPASPPAPISNVVAIAAGGSHALALIGDGRPLIIRPPAGGTSWVGRDLTLHARAAGMAPMHYQWRHDGANLPGATNLDLPLLNLSMTHSGWYQLIVSNALGWTTSVPVPLTVRDSPGLACPSPLPASLTNDQGGTLTLSATFAGNGPLFHQWRTNDSFGVPHNLAGQTNVSLVFDPLTLADAGAYSVLASNLDGGSLAVPATTLLVNSARAWGYYASPPPAAFTNAAAVAPANTHYLVLRMDGTVGMWSASLPPASHPLTNVTAIAAASYHSLALLADGRPFAWGAYSTTYGLTNPPAAASNVTAIACGSFHDLALRSNGTVVAWGYNLNGQTSVPGSASNVVAIAVGSRHNLALRADGTVVGWGYNNRGQTSIPAGATNIIAVAAGDAHSLALRSDGRVMGWGDNTAGQISVPPDLEDVVAISASSSHSMALRADGTVAYWGYPYAATGLPGYLSNVTKISNGGEQGAAVFGVRAPVITIAPFSRSAFKGADVTLAAKAVGAQPVSYQWRRNGTSIPGATKTTLTLTNLQVDREGAYQLVASNHFGIAISPAAALVVLPEPTLLAQPVSIRTNAGATVQFTVGVAGAGPLTYQWRQNDTNALGTSNPTLILTNVSRADNGRYFVTVSNPAGSVQTSNAILHVLVPQKLKLPILLPDGRVLVSSGDADGGTLTEADLAGFKVLASSDLKTWIELTNALALTNGTLWLEETAQTNHAARFYRILETYP